jgi:hypothetical protein
MEVVVRMKVNAFQEVAHWRAGGKDDGEVAQISSRLRCPYIKAGAGADATTIRICHPLHGLSYRSRRR